MVKYIKSESVKRYLEKEQIVLSDRHICAYICNMRLGWEDVKSTLGEIVEKTLDLELKEQVVEKIQNVEKGIAFFICSEGLNVYELYEYSKDDKEYFSRGYYSSFDLAKNRADAFADKYKIRKIRVHEGENIEEALGEDMLEEIYYMADGQIEYPKIYINSEEGFNAAFEEIAYFYPHPFCKGDIVKRMDSDDKKLYLVCDCKAYEEIRKNNENIEYADAGIWLVALEVDTGKIWDMDEPVHPYELEYYFLPPDDERSIADNIIEAMSNMVKGDRYSFQYIQDGCLKLLEQYEDGITCRLITGFEIKRKNLMF